MSQEVIITKGLSGSGKTTWAKDLLKRFPGKYKIICKDDLRRMLDDDSHSAAKEKFIIAARNVLIDLALKEKMSVVIADTNLNPKHEKEIRDIVNIFNCLNNTKIEVKVESFLDVPVDQCIAQDLKRYHSVGEKVIRQQLQWIENEKQGDHNYKRTKQNENLRRAIIVDIDGTIAIKGDRNPFDYDKVDLDLPNHDVIKLVKAYAKLGAHIIFMSGRDDSCFEKTISWINKHTGMKAAQGMYELYMRKTGDKRKDSVVKKELFDQFVKNFYFIEFVLDDRNQVVDMWRKELGLTCMQVNYGDF